MKKLLFVSFFISLSLYSKVIQKEVAYVHKGNLALRTSQQPAPLFCFGQFLVDKGNIQGFFSPEWLTSSQKYFSSLVPSMVYGFENNVAFLGGIPFAVKYKQETVGSYHLCHPELVSGSKSSGVGDIFAQVEYGFYIHEGLTYVNKLTLVSGLTLATGSAKKNPPTGVGASNLFMGFTAHHRAIDWYYWISPGLNYTVPQNGIKPGVNFLYQAGLARNIFYLTEKQIITLMLEMLGSYTANGEQGGVRKTSTNTFSLAPTLWISTMHFILKAGVLIPVVQQSINPADKDNYKVVLTAGWTFN